MINLLIGLAIIALVLWTARRFYFPTEQAEHPERYPAPQSPVSRRELTTVMTTLQRWRKEGKITREEYDHLTDICLSEMEQISKKQGAS